MKKLKTNIDYCTGCGVCANICPNGAIKMKENQEGFLEPFFDEDLCNHCGMCEKKCPQLNFEFKNEAQRKCYGIISNDELRKESSSGGVFSVLAQHFLENDGFVVGASFDEDFLVRHIIISNLKDLEKLRTSKYVQSDLGNIFSETKALLEKGSKVLFSGTPCQIAGLYSFLGKEYSKLITIDVLCHGVPSPLAFRKYLEEYKQNDEKIEKINFRYKNSNSDKGITLFIETDKMKYYLNEKQDFFLRGFLSNLINRNSCSVCNFATGKRVGDITLGDFWGIENYNPDLSSQKGVSFVTLNNQKGLDLFNKIKENFETIEEYKTSGTEKYNQVLRKPFEAHSKRKQFFRNLNELSFEKNIEECLFEKYDVGVLNFWYTCNYGAILTAFALCKLIRSFNYSVSLINNAAYFYKEKRNSFSKNFENKYLTLTNYCASPKDFEDLNKKIDTFIVGSDQVFRFDYISNNVFAHFLDFVKFGKKRVAFSASFGQNYINFPSDCVNGIKKALEKFDYISVREKTGVRICKKHFNLDADWIIDPVFLADKKIYEELMDTVSKDYSNKIFSYILDENEKQKPLQQALSNKFNCEMVKIEENDSPEVWLKKLMQSKCVITDSFHGVCFSLIFNKPFVCLLNRKRGAARFDFFINDLNLGQFFFENPQECIDNLNNLDFNIDYDIINEQLGNLKVFGVKKLQEILGAKNKFNESLLVDCIEEQENKIKMLEDKTFELEKEIKQFQEQNAFQKSLKSFICKIKLLMLCR